MKTILTILLLFFIHVSYGQYVWTPAQVYLKNGKVLKGEARLIAHDPGNLAPKKERVSYRKSKKTKKQKLDARKIDYIIFTVSYKKKVARRKITKTVKEKYIPMYLKKKKKHLRFVQLIIDGKVQLLGRSISGGYYGPGVGSVNAGGVIVANPTSTGFYYGNHNQLLLARSESIPEVFNHKSLKKSFKKRAMAFFSDCKSLVSKIEAKSYKREDLIAIVEHYNKNCE